MTSDGYVQCQNSGCEAWYPEAWDFCPICQIEENVAHKQIKESINGEQQWKEK